MFTTYIILLSLYSRGDSLPNFRWGNHIYYLFDSYGIKRVKLYYRNKKQLNHLYHAVTSTKNVSRSEQLIATL